MSLPSRPIICLDFDGVIHRYSEGWRGGEIYDPPVPGFSAWASEAARTFRLVVYSSRSASNAGRLNMIEWMQRHDIDPSDFEFMAEKPAAFLTIDDRCIPFKGDWQDPLLAPEVLASFKPWNMIK